MPIAPTYASGGEFRSIELKQLLADILSQGVGKSAWTDNIAIGQKVASHSLEETLFVSECVKID